jgi:cation diffusion facilitator family transporter
VPLPPAPPAVLRGPIILSLIAAVLTIGMKAAAYAMTGSAGLLSDALESGVNLLAAIMAALSLWYAAKPADPQHTYGHEKIEFFSSGFEGALIFVAGGATIVYAIQRLIRVQPLEQIDIGLVLALIASAVNAVVGVILIRVGRAQNSLILTANGTHLLTDVLTSIGVVVGLVIVRLTGREWPDAVVALLVGGSILLTGFRLIRTAFDGLMDRALPDAEQNSLRDLIRQSLPVGAAFHGLRTRRAGRRIFAELHLLMPGRTPLANAHTAGHRLEETVKAQWPDLELTIHHEPIEDEASWEPELAQLGEPTTPGTGDAR